MSSVSQLLINTGAILVGAYITYRALWDIVPPPKEIPLPKVPHFWSDDNSPFLLELDGVNRLEPLTLQPVNSTLAVMKIGNGLLETGTPVIGQAQQTLSKVSENKAVSTTNHFAAIGDQENL